MSTEEEISSFLQEVPPQVAKYNPERVLGLFKTHAGRKLKSTLATFSKFLQTATNSRLKVCSWRLVNTSFGKRAIVMQVFCRVSSLSRDAQTTTETPNNSYSFSGVVRSCSLFPAEQHSRSSMFWVFPRVFLWQELPGNTSRGRHPGSHHSYYLLMWSISGSTLNFLWVTELLAHRAPHHPAEETSFARLYPASFLLNFGS